MIGVAGTGGVAVNAAFMGNVITNTIAAEIADSWVYADDVSVDAESEAGILAVTFGVAGSGACAINLTGFGNVITNSVRATVRDNSNIDADGWVDLEASDDSSIRSAGVSIAGATVGIGALIGANVITNSVLARISGSRVKSGAADFNFYGTDGILSTIPGLGLRMHAENNSEIMSFSGGLAIGAGAGTISLSANVVANRTEAVIEGSQVDRGGQRLP